MTRYAVVALLVLAACAAERHASPPAPDVVSMAKPLASIHAAVDRAIDAHDYETARTTLLAALTPEVEPVEQQDLLQRLAWVELQANALDAAHDHAAGALALGHTDALTYGNALVVGRLVAVARGEADRAASLAAQLRAIPPPSP